MVIASIWNDITIEDISDFEIFWCEISARTYGYWSNLRGTYDWLETLGAIDNWISYNTLLNQKIPYNSFAFPQSCVSFQGNPHV